MRCNPLPPSQIPDSDIVPRGYAFNVCIQRPSGDCDNVLRNDIRGNDWVRLLDSGGVGGFHGSSGIAVLPCADDTGHNKGVSIGVL